MLQLFIERHIAAFVSLFSFHFCFRVLHGNIVRREVYLAYVVMRDGEDGEALVKRFQSIIQRSGIMRELRDRRFFRSKGEQTRIDKARAIRRARRRRRRV